MVFVNVTPKRSQCKLGKCFIYRDLYSSRIKSFNMLLYNFDQNARVEKKTTKKKGATGYCINLVVYWFDVRT